MGLGVLNLILGFAMYDLIIIQKEYIIGFVATFGVFLSINYLILLTGFETLTQSNKKFVS